MKFKIKCHNDECKHYFEDGCYNTDVKTIVLDEDGKCENFEDGINEMYSHD
jgi:hypothetical protein